MSEPSPAHIRPDFAEVAAALQGLGALADPAECQGQLCGLLCLRGGALDRESWLQRLFPEYDPRDLLARDSAAVLLRLFDTTQLQLASAEFGFQLLLPDDSDPLAERTEALGNWCQGFLSGLAETGVTDLRALPGELPELLHDFAEIAHAGSFELDEEEADEEAYAELVEYVRVGVMLVDEEMRSMPAADDATVH